MKPNAETITDEQIHELREGARARRNTWLIGICDVASSDLDSDRDVAAYRIKCRARCAEIFNVRAREKCPGRDHRNHVSDVCEGTCCTACGGPIDENEECRC